MTDQEILTKAIEKAIAGGWDTTFMGTVGPLKYTVEGLEWGSSVIASCEEQLIFDHEFAKALWPGQINGPGFLGPLWYFHLQQMVVADDPIKYLAGNI